MEWKTKPSCTTYTEMQTPASRKMKKGKFLFLFFLLSSVKIMDMMYKNNHRKTLKTDLRTSWLTGKESACNAGDLGWEDPLEKGNDYLLQYSWTEKAGKILSIDLPYDPEISLLGKELKIVAWVGIGTPMFIAALIIATKMWKQPRCPRMDERTSKKCGVYMQQNVSQP